MPLWNIAERLAREALARRKFAKEAAAEEAAKEEVERPPYSPEEERERTVINQLKKGKRDVRFDAIREMGIIKSKRFIEPLMTTALHDDDFMVRFQATNALLSLDFETGISILLQQVSSEESWYNRSNAIHGLKQYYVSKGKTGEAVDLLISSLNDKHPNVRGEAAWFLGAFKSERSYEPLLRLAQSDKKISVRLRAASSIACLNPEKGLELLTNLLKRCDDIETYCWAIRGLGRIKSEKSVQLIRPYLKSDFSEVRSVAEEIIAKIK